MDVKLPSLGEESTEATVSMWLVEEGEKVTEGQDILEMATDKAVFNVPSPVVGVLKKKKVSDGDVVKVGGDLCFIE